MVDRHDHDQLELVSSIDSADLVFTQASPSQHKRTWDFNCTSWAPPLSATDYKARETLLLTQDLTANGRFRGWLLHRANDPADIVSSCELFHKTLYIRRPGDSGTVEECLAFGIASVFTNMRYRRQGMAEILLRRLQERMDSEGAELSVLYSDIDSEYYSRLGWVAFPTPQVTIHLLGKGPVRLGISDPERCVRFMNMKDESYMRAICARDEEQLKARLETIDTSDGKTHIAFAPSYAQIAWHLVSEAFVERALHGRDIERCGVITADGRSWVVWQRDWLEKKLKIHRIVITSESEEQRVADAIELLRAAVEEASTWGLQSVLAWSPDGATVRAAEGLGKAYGDVLSIVFSERIKGSVPCLRLNGGKDTSNILWEDNQNYGWC